MLEVEFIFKNFFSVISIFILFCRKAIWLNYKKPIFFMLRNRCFNQGCLRYSWFYSCWFVKVSFLKNQRAGKRANKQWKLFSFFLKKISQKTANLFHLLNRIVVPIVINIFQNRSQKWKLWMQLGKNRQLKSWYI